VPLPLDLGLTDASRRTPDQPLYTLRNKATGATGQTTDLGGALVSGRWQDIGRFKGPTLRAGTTRTVFSQRVGDGSARGGPLLRRPLRHRLQRGGEG
jgi:hypothetical protein